MEDKLIYLSRKKPPRNNQGCVKLSPEAYESLMGIVEETDMSVKQVASEIVYQAIKKNLIRFEN